MKITKNQIIYLLIGIIIVLVISIILLFTVFSNNSFQLNNNSNNQSNQSQNQIPNNQEENNQSQNQNTNENKEPTKTPTSTKTPTPTSTPKPTSMPTPIPTPVPTPTPETYTEQDVIAYFETENETIDNTTWKEKVKNAFTTTVDFIFYDKEIKGYTFKEQTTSAKIKIIEIALSIDSKIETKFPNYKETLGEKYQNIKGKLAYFYLEITSSLCESVGADTCLQAKSDFNDMKESFSFTWELIKELTKHGKDKVFEFYEKTFKE